jgi:hypothetical protein
VTNAKGIEQQGVAAGPVSQRSQSSAPRRGLPCAAPGAAPSIGTGRSRDLDRWGLRCRALVRRISNDLSSAAIIDDQKPVKENRSTCSKHTVK